MTSHILTDETLVGLTKQLKQQLSMEPIKVLQIGEGNFLRGFFDWMLHETRKQGLYSGSVAVVQPRPSGKPKIEALAAQDGVYTLVTRGLENHQPLERVEQITVFQKVFDSYANWQQFLQLAELPELRIVVSNTTEAGLIYQPEAFQEGIPIQSFPGKLTALLYRRFTTFHGDPDKGLICLPCELLERNGDTLLACILKYCEDWQLSKEFQAWIKEHNYFLNSLVDRIVTGYPAEAQAEAWFAEWGYRDSQLTTAEPYHLWVIEGDAKLAAELPFAEAGLNVKWVDQLKPYQERKVRILNGAHTFLALYGSLRGYKEVRLAMEDSKISHMVKQTIQLEIIPSLPYAKAELEEYAATVYERFLNPFIQHRLSDIAMNSLSKFKTRFFPAIHYYLHEKHLAELPEGLATAFAALLRYYQIKKTDAGYEGVTFNGERYQLRDDEQLLEKIALVWNSNLCNNSSQPAYYHCASKLLELEELWGANLHKQYPNLALQLSSILQQWEEE